MTKNDIANALTQRVPEISKSAALHAVEALTDILSEAFVAGDDIFLRGFGTFNVVDRKEKKARNINTGATVMVPACRLVKFQPSNNLKNRMNNGTVD